MQDLIGRLEKATGPDRQLDFDIWSVASPDGISQRATPDADLKMPWPQWAEYWKRDRDAYGHYTASIDAALTLVPQEDSQNFEVSIEQQKRRRYGANVFWDVIIGHHCFDAWVGSHPSPAIAICIAALKARLALAELKPQQGKSS